VSVLETAISVKFFASGTPFEGQRDDWRAAGAAKESVIRNEVINARENIMMLSVLLTFKLAVVLDE